MWIRCTHKQTVGYAVIIKVLLLLSLLLLFVNRSSISFYQYSTSEYSNHP